MRIKEGSIAESIWGFGRIAIGLLPLVFIVLYFNLVYVIIYFVIGFITFLFIKAKNTMRALIFTLMFWPVVLLLWRDFFNEKELSNKKQSLLDKVNEIIDKDPILRLNVEYFKEMCKDGTDQDVIQWGTGEFGLEATNPIPVHGIFGSMSYLERIRTLDGVNVEHERLGSVHVPNINNPVDKYKISQNGKELTTFYISPYHKKNSNKAPKGFKNIF